MTWTLDHLHPSSRTSIKAFPSYPFPPLSFDKAASTTQGKTKKPYPSRSNFPFFRLPIELLHQITPYIPSGDLETLSWIDRDCLQLVRSVRFTNVVMGYSEGSLGLLDVLLGEMTEGDDANAYTYPCPCPKSRTKAYDGYALGPCIRHVTIDLGPPIIDDTRLARFPNINAFAHANIFNVDEDRSTPEQTYLLALSTALAHTMPNLQSIDWESRTYLSSEVFKGIMESPAQNVTLRRAVVGAWVMDAFRDMEREMWGLETLSVDIEWVDDNNDTDRGSCEDDKVTESDFMETILDYVAPTLRSLTWKGCRGRGTSRSRRGGHPYLYQFRSSQHYFPNLRILTLQNLPMGDSTILKTLLSTRTVVRSLTIDCGDDAVTTGFLSKRGYISSLEGFCWKDSSRSRSRARAGSHSLRDTDIDSDPDLLILSFLAENPQLVSFSCSARLEVEFIEREVLSVFVPVPVPVPVPVDVSYPHFSSLSSYSHFPSHPLSLTSLPTTSLTSLHLTFPSPTIPHTSLHLISTIRTLEHLWLSAGNQGGWCHDWEIDHPLMMDILGTGLRKLKTLGYTRDSYQVGGRHTLQDPSVSMYYVNKILPTSINPRLFLKEDEVGVLEKLEKGVEGLEDGYVSGYAYADPAHLVDQARLIQRRLLSAAWERYHRSRMGEVVREYASRLGCLEWCFVGQIGVGIEVGVEGERIVIETPFRNEDGKVLERRWERCCGLV